MQYRFPLVVFALLAIFAQPSFARREYFEKAPGYFGFTRACLADLEGYKQDKGGCITSFIPSAVIDSVTSPIQTMIKITEYMERPSKDASSSDQKSSQSDSSKKAQSSSEIPEEKKIANRLSLYMAVADDARGYLLSGSSTPLLNSAVEAIRFMNPEVSGNDDFTIESQKLLDLESEILQILSQEF